MRIFVTGAAGFVGRALSAYLAGQGHDVVRAVRAHVPNQEGASWLITGDLAHCATLARDLKGIDAVVHAAGRAHVIHELAQNPKEAFYQANVVATERLAAAALEAGVRRFVLISSIGVHGRNVNTPITESHPIQPGEPYAHAKWQAEQRLHTLCSGHAMQLVIVRPTLIYGPYCPGNMARLIRWVAHGWPLPFGRLTQPRSVLGIDPLCDLIHLLLTHPKAAGERFVAADPQRISLVQILEALAKGLNRPIRLWPMPLPLLRAAARLLGASDAFEKLTKPLQVDASKAHTLLGWAPKHSTEEGLRAAAASFVLPD